MSEGEWCILGEEIEGWWCEWGRKKKELVFGSVGEEVVWRNSGDREVGNEEGEKKDLVR